VRQTLKLTTFTLGIDSDNAFQNARKDLSGDDAMAGHNPFRVGPNELGPLGTTPSPRVAEYRNPGLWDETPSGLLAAHR
jgi:hypothetical protein